MLAKTDKFLEAIFRTGAGLAFGVLIFAVMVQVLGRSVFANSPVWTEELTRFALLYLTAFGVGLALKSGDLVNVDVVCEGLPGKAPWVLRVVALLTTAGLCLVLLGPSWAFTKIGALQTSPALGWRMNFIHATMTVLLGSLLVFAAIRAMMMVSGRTDGLPPNRTPVE